MVIYGITNNDRNYYCLCLAHLFGRLIFGNSRFAALFEVEVVCTTSVLVHFGVVSSVSGFSVWDFDIGCDWLVFPIAILFEFCFDFGFDVCCSVGEFL